MSKLPNSIHRRGNSLQKLRDASGQCRLHPCFLPLQASEKETEEMALCSADSFVCFDCRRNHRIQLLHQPRQKEL